MQLSRAHVRAVLRLSKINWIHVGPRRAERITTQCEHLLRRVPRVTSVAGVQAPRRVLAHYTRALRSIMDQLGMPVPLDAPRGLPRAMRGGR
jgi:hypothetical protein